MADIERREVETVDTRVNEQGAVVEERTASAQTKADGKSTTINFVWYIYGFMAILLGLRMVLKLFGANSGNAFVSLIYSVSGVLSAPFDTIFGVAKAQAGSTRAVFEPSILVAIIVYGLIAWGIAKFLSLNEAKK